MHYLITGHTGFKGSWLSLMLQMQGHEVSGISLNPPQRSLFVQANLEGIFTNDFRVDIRNRSDLTKAIHKVDPDVIVHLAAQPLVRAAYKYPLETFETNVIGTLNVLKATQDLGKLRAALIITTDKVYKNHNSLREYVETDDLGGDDPYSASKAACDIAAQSWIKSFTTTPIAIARAGNVIGGGDWATDRIIPDLVSAYSTHQLPTVRFPDAIRPWQHVLDCLNGYTKLINFMLETKTAGEWNFGPHLDQKYTVSDLVELFAAEWGIYGETWRREETKQPEESGYLLLNSDKARKLLKWNEVLTFQNSIATTAKWYREALKGNSAYQTRKEIGDFLAS